MDPDYIPYLPFFFPSFLSSLTPLLLVFFFSSLSFSLLSLLCFPSISPLHSFSPSVLQFLGGLLHDRRESPRIVKLSKDGSIVPPSVQQVRGLVCVCMCVRVYVCLCVQLFAIAALQTRAPTRSRIHSVTHTLTYSSHLLSCSLAHSLAHSLTFFTVCSCSLHPDSSSSLLLVLEIPHPLNSGSTQPNLTAGI